MAMITAYKSMTPKKWIAFDKYKDIDGLRKGLKMPRAEML
jgi:hypothetical protein